jgi:hypothetical protein
MKHGLSVEARAALLRQHLDDGDALSPKPSVSGRGTLTALGA